MSSEKRAYERKPLRLELNYRDAEGGNFLFEYSSNISGGGIFIETQHPLPIGATLVIRFKPEGDEIEVEGSVAWVNPWRENEDNPNPGMGIKWDLEDEQHDIIASIVKAIAILPGG
jgi:type IV pilus assembly protein PilZ